MSADPIGQAGGVNVYRYALNNPLHWIAPGTTTWYLWDGDRLLAEYEELTPTTDERRVRYAYAGGFAPVQVAHGAPGAEVIYDVHTDHLDTPRMLTDANETVVWRAAYEAFGQAEVDENPDGDGTSVTFNIRFPGQYFDEETGLHYNRFRYYDPRLGRYISADPIGQRAGPNLYAYAFNNPLNWIDPLGLGPNDPYPTRDAAGIAGATDAAARTGETGNEFAGRIYETREGVYSYTEPREGTPTESTIGKVPSVTKNAGDYHSHPESDPDSPDDEFSDSDKLGNDHLGVPGYLGLPDGRVQKYNPDPDRRGKGVVEQLKGPDRAKDDECE